MVNLGNIIVAGITIDIMNKSLHDMKTLAKKDSKLGTHKLEVDKGAGLGLF